MKAMLCAIAESVGPALGQRWSDSRIAGVVEEYGAPQTKKKMVIAHSDLDPELDPRGVPREREVSPADETQLLDELGEFLRVEKGLAAGPILDDQRTEVLNEAVAYYYRELAALAASLQPQELLEWLVGHHEALLKARASGKLTLTTRLACFRDARESLCTLGGRTGCSIEGGDCQSLRHRVRSRPPCQRLSADELLGA